VTIVMVVAAHSLSVVIPAYNEEESVLSTTQRVFDALDGQFEDYELLLINDASTDRTGEIANQLAAEHPVVRVLHNPVNLGQGASLVKGFQHATKDLIIHNAMDYPFDLRDLPRMVKLLDHADVVVAARDRRAGYSVYRHFLSWGNLMLLNTLFPLRLHDYNFVQLYRREVLRSVDFQCTSTAFLIPHILIQAHELGCRIREVSVEYHPRNHGVATAGSPRVVLHSIRDMFSFWLGRRKR